MMHDGVRGKQAELHLLPTRYTEVVVSFKLPSLYLREKG
jgi:hypothetical protein